jgi:hypothetical protein
MQESAEIGYFSALSCIASEMWTLLAGVQRKEAATVPPSITIICTCPVGGVHYGAPK